MGTTVNAPNEYRCSAETAREIVRPALARAAGLDNGSALRPTLNEDYRLLAATTERDLVDTVIAVPCSDTTYHDGDALGRGVRLSWETLRRAEEWLEVIGESHSHPVDREPTTYDVRALASMETLIRRPLMGLVVGYTLVFGGLACLCHEGMPYPLALEPMSEDRMLIQRLVARVQGNGPDAILDLLVDAYINGFEAYTRAYRSDGSPLAFRVVGRELE